MVPVAILAGGLASRLYPITLKTPKSLLEVAGEPFISHQLRELKKQNIQKVVLCVGHLGEQIEEFVKDGSRFDICVKYSYESKKLLGTGGAIKKAIPLLGKKFFVLYGDSFLKIDYYSVYKNFESSGCKALMTVFKNKGRWDNSNIEIHGKRIKNYSKTKQNLRMTHIDYGLGFFEQEVFQKYPEDTNFDLSAVYQELVNIRKLASFEAENRFYEIGSKEGLDELNQLFKKKKYELYS